MALSRRGVLALGACFGVGAAVGARVGLPSALGPGLPREVRGRARELVDEAFEGLDRSRMWDAHVHLTGLGTGGTGCWVNPEMRALTAPWRHFKFDVYRHAAGITDLSRADQQYVERLLEAHRLTNPAGEPSPTASTTSSTNPARSARPRASSSCPTSTSSLAKLHPEILPCASIHPYRADAVDRLNRAASDGAVAIKWLPNAMGMDPASARCDAFYDRLVALGLPLISHAGHELAVHSPDAQELGNPLRLRRALERGVRVVVAHAASLGVVAEISTPPRG